MTQGKLLLISLVDSLSPHVSKFTVPESLTYINAKHEYNIDKNDETGPPKTRPAHVVPCFDIRHEISEREQVVTNDDQNTLIEYFKRIECKLSMRAEVANVDNVK
eukprot:CAMPEP_0116872774 /NCGR_PEP_ID=MMETSP0463-20121206/3633_1 /TAXON_ID=181622 /ORGANISM="Strombidinopsis sp, Strain SopsisLIS2011" /LENGTH=104 /DNA_ID=CAMNT_0004513549 /DNA_START=437 /DNA_END=751 /DNA_ORIENTATION=+